MAVSPLHHALRALLGLREHADELNPGVPATTAVLTIHGAEAEAKANAAAAEIRRACDAAVAAIAELPSILGVGPVGTDTKGFAARPGVAATTVSAVALRASFNINVGAIGDGGNNNNNDGGGGAGAGGGAGGGDNGTGANAGVGAGAGAGGGTTGHQPLSASSDDTDGGGGAGGGFMPACAAGGASARAAAAFGGSVGINPRGGAG
eukprot:g5870.t1